MTPPPAFSGLIADGVPEPVRLSIGLERALPGTLSLPPHPAGIVLQVLLVRCHQTRHSSGSHAEA